MSTSINPREIEHFTRDSARWWDEDGPFRPLHRLGPLRLRYLTGRIENRFGSPPSGLRVLDIGCGGGLVCEPLARLGADVTGIDADGQAIAVAQEHAKLSGLKINYAATTAENLLDRGKAYDVVLALEIVEHVSDLNGFVSSCAALCKPGGLLIFSTLNRTPQSFALGIVAAEYILRWVPRGTHDWKKFVRPSELAAASRRAALNPAGIQGYVFNPLAGEFGLSDNVAVNYFLVAEKP